ACKWIEKMTFVQQCAVKIAELFLPKKLLAGEHDLFQFAMRCDKKMRRRGFETDPTLDSQNRVTEMNTSPDSVLPSDRVQRVNHRDRAVCYSINFRRSSFIEANGYRLRRQRRINFLSGISFVGQMLPGVMCLLSANTRTPHSLVNAVLLELLRKCESA